MESLLSSSARGDLDYLATFVKNTNAELECKVLSGQIQTKDIADRIIKTIEGFSATTATEAVHATFSYPDGVRVIARGAENIHKICTTNSFKGSQVKVERKTRYFGGHGVGGHDDMIDIPESGIRFTLRKEEEIRRDFSGTPMDATSHVRVINRKSWKTQDGLLQIDFSLVKSKVKGMKAFSEILRQNPAYELEVEVLDRKADPKRIVESLIVHIEYLLVAFQGSSFILPSSDIKRYGMEFNSSGHKFLNPVTMKRRHIRADRPNNILTGYTVTNKADGQRCFITVMRDKRMLMIRPNGSITWTGMTAVKDLHIGDVVDGEYIEERNLFCIFDVYSFRGKNTTRLPLFTTDEDVIANPLASRLGCAREFVSDLRKDFTTQPNGKPLRVETKLFLAGDGPAMEDAINTMLNTKFEYETDGLIFTPRSTPVAPLADRRGNTWTTVYKWKPAEQNSIDFLVKFKPGETFDTVLKQRVFKGQLYIGRTRGFDIVYPIETMTGEYTPPQLPPELQVLAEARDRVPGVFQPSVPRNPEAYNIMIPLDAKGVPVDSHGQRVEDNTIIECVRDVEKDRWVILRTRYDKTYQYRVLHQPQFGNDVATANSIWTNIHVPVTEEMLMSCVSTPPDDTFEDDLYYRDDLGSRDRVLKDTYAFHNKIKASLFKQTVKPGSTLLELAMGRGGDLLKWKEAKPSRVVGMDIASGNLESPVQGACVRYIREQAQGRADRLPPALFVVGDMTQPLYEQDNRYIRILAGLEPAPTPYLQQFAGLKMFDAISCQMALHYACTSEETFKVFTKNLVDHGKGVFFGTCMDGAAVYASLMGKKSTLFRADGQVFGEITKQYTDGDTWREEFGQIISVKLESFERPMDEALVPFGKITELLGEAGYELISTTMFADHYAQQTAITLTQEHQAFSFLHRSFVFKRSAPKPVEAPKQPKAQEPEVPAESQPEKVEDVQVVNLPTTDAAAPGPVAAEPPAPKPKAVKKKLIKAAPTAPNEEAKPVEPVLFFGADESKGEYRFMSNMFVAPFEIDGMTFPTVEHYYQWSKAMMFEGKDSETGAKMMKPPRNKEFTEAKSVKALGRKVKEYSDAKWDDVKIPIMEKALRAKFVNPKHGLLEKLLATGNRPIGEANPRDKYWGIGTSADTADAKNPAKWKGQNQLGKLLMKLRDEFTEAKKE